MAYWDELKSLIKVLVRSVRTISAQWFPPLRINKEKAVKVKVVVRAIIYIRMSRNESQPVLHLVEKLATPLRRLYRQKLHRVMITVWIKTSHFGYTLFFHIRMLFFRARLNVLIFPPILA